LPCKYTENSMKQKMYRGSNCIRLINLTKQTIFFLNIPLIESMGRRRKKKEIDF
jgi:hypothetical protein